MKIFERQCEIALDNLPKLYAAVGDRATIIFMSGTDFGQQTGTFISRKAYRQLYQPFQRRLNDWVRRSGETLHGKVTAVALERVLHDDVPYYYEDPMALLAQTVEPMAEPTLE